mgnify:CR=1 FL=1
MNILVVDDNRISRENISTILISLGHNVSTAVNGLDGFEKAQKGSFNLYIIDHLMPLMNGVLLSKNIKNSPELEQNPILFMTTKGKESVENLPEVNLFNKVISKPLEEDEFILAVKSLIGNIPSTIAS